MASAFCTLWNEPGYLGKTVLGSNSNPSACRVCGSSGPLAPCIVKFADGKIFEIKMVPRFRKIGNKTMCYIAATWREQRELKKNEIKAREAEQPLYIKLVLTEKLKN